MTAENRESLGEFGAGGTAAQAAGESPRQRRFFFDNLKVALTMLVIAHHVGQAYGPTGGSWPVMEAAKAPFLGPFFTVNRSFFMSLFFFISGYFLVGALDRHGAKGFIRGRLARLGIPVLVFMAAMVPIRIFLFHEVIARWDDVLNAGHLWYLEHVLLFSLLYVLFAFLRRGKAGRSSAPKAGSRGYPSALSTAICLIIVACISGIVRIWSPIDRWFNLLGFFRVAFADLPRDSALFILGILAARRGWVDAYPARKGYAWLAVGAAAALAWYLWALVPALHYQLGGTSFALLYPLWEGLVCFGFCIGLLVLFREALNRQGRLARFLGENQYSAYIWHPMVVVPIQMAALGLQLGPSAKFLLVTALSIPLVFLWSRLMRGSVGKKS
jgi:glucans biosynthesis protein C